MVSKNLIFKLKNSLVQKPEALINIVLISIMVLYLYRMFAYIAHVIGALFFLSGFLLCKYNCRFKIGT